MKSLLEEKMTQNKDDDNYNKVSTNKTGQVINESIAKDDTKQSNNPIEQKPIKPEEKPFKDFILEHLIPGLSTAIFQKSKQHPIIELSEGERPVVGGYCWTVKGQLQGGREFLLSFSEDKITSGKTIALVESGSSPSTIESFLIDEKKTTLALLISRTLQRLNGQKWLGPN